MALDSRRTGTPAAGSVYLRFRLYESYRGKGFAKQALNALDEMAGNMGIRKLSLHVFAHNETARRLYERAGFQETDVIMSKKL
ncbi:GNAT family N-acetyltransferase [Bacillus halotolerans]|uniref:GNAT family N-acetyltransferase n=1 Tax=Bacillus halotolerans TaxID=260554 RepID=UPI00403F495C